MEKLKTDRSLLENNEFLDNSLIDQKIILFLKKLKSKKFLPNLIFLGKPGVGKTTTAKDLIRNFSDRPLEYLELDSSKDRGIATIRELVVPFSSTRSSIGPLRIVLFEEAENLTNEAQAALRKTMEVNGEICRFIFTCNKNSLDPAIKSRCVTIPFKINEKLLKIKLNGKETTDLRYSNRILEEEFKTQDQDNNLKFFYGLILKRDRKLLKEEYTNLISNKLPSVQGIRNSYKVIKEEKFFSISYKLIQLFIQFENDLFISQDQFLPITRLLYHLSKIDDQESKQ